MTCVEKKFKCNLELKSKLGNKEKVIFMTFNRIILMKVVNVEVVNSTKLMFSILLRENIQSLRM